MVFRRRALRARRPVKGRKPARRMRMRRPTRLANGQLRLKRQAQSVVIRNTAVAGTPAVNGYNGAGVVNSLVQLGTPEQDVNYSHAIYNVPFSCQFSLNQVVQSSELGVIADRYSIKGVGIKLKYNSNTADAGSSTTLLGNQPTVKYVYDFDDSTPSNVSGLQQKMGLTSRLLAANKYVKIYVRPRTSGSVLGGAAGGTQINRPGIFLDMNQLDIPHFGVKGFIEGMNLQSTTQLDSLVQFEFTYYLTLKDIQ